jgi:hypothetical protein
VPHAHILNNTPQDNSGEEEEEEDDDDDDEHDRLDSVEVPRGRTCPSSSSSFYTFSSCHDSRGCTGWGRVQVAAAGAGAEAWDAASEVEWDAWLAAVSDTEWDTSLAALSDTEWGTSLADLSDTEWGTSLAGLLDFSLAAEWDTEWGGEWVLLWGPWSSQRCTLLPEWGCTMAARYSS